MMILTISFDEPTAGGRHGDGQAGSGMLGGGRLGSRPYTWVQKSADYIQCAISVNEKFKLYIQSNVVLNPVKEQLFQNPLKGHLIQNPLKEHLIQHVFTLHKAIYRCFIHHLKLNTRSMLKI